MIADSMLSRELKSLHEELSIARRERAVQNAPGPGTAGSGETSASVGPPEESAAEKGLHGEIRDLVKEITDFVEDAEKNVSAHPTLSIVAAMLLGMLIGSMLGRR